MSHSVFLNWAAITFSIFNTILLLWLGLTVLLNAERRVVGVWITGSGLIVAAAFFISHTIILQRGLSYPDWQFAFWWKGAVLPANFLPFAWYVVMLWYAGYWQEAQSQLVRRHRWWFRLISLTMLFGMLTLIVIPSQPASPYGDRFLDLIAPGSAWARPFLIFLVVGFSGYITLTMFLSLDVLRHPGPASRLMGDVARQRAKPWLMATTFALLLVTLLVTWTLLWISRNLLEGNVFLWQPQTYDTLARFDLWIVIVLTAAIVLLGQATVAYEIFTGKSLPRFGLRRQWWRVLSLGVMYSLVASGLIVFEFPRVHGILLLTILTTVFVALLGWRSYEERQGTIASLRHFVNSERLYDRLLSDSSGRSADIRPSFVALCRDVLETSVAFLIPVGPLATLVNERYSWPTQKTPPAVDSLIARDPTPDQISMPLEPGAWEKARWGIPLWNQRGLIGFLLLGDKLGGGLYTEEEIEVARSSGEQLIDHLATSEIAARLMTLQRERMVESQLLDQQTRRILHDDVLPQLHTAMLTLSGANGKQEAVSLLSGAHKQISDLLHSMPRTAAQPVQKYGLVEALERLLQEEFAHAFERVDWLVDDAARRVSDHLNPLTAEVTYYAAREAIRNAAKYGRGENGERPLALTLTMKAVQELIFQIQDDGVGVQNHLLAGRQDRHSGGHGLNLHSTMMAVVGGELVVDSLPEKYTRVELRLPLKK